MQTVEEHRTTLQRRVEMSFTQGTSGGYKRKPANGTKKDALTDDEKVDEKLKERGIDIVDSDVRNFSNISPSEVADYYKGLGDWQNVLPKTDYAYSPMSVYNKKKINGIYPVIPNMSRRKLWSNGYESVAPTDWQTNTVDYRYRAHKSSSHTHSHVQSNREGPAVNAASNFANLRQWISNKRSSVLHSSTELYQRWRSYFKKMRTASSAAVSSPSSSSWRKILVQFVFPFLLLLLVSYLFLWSPFPAPSSSPVDYLYKCSGVVYFCVSSLIKSLFSLVHRIVDFTISSVTFTLSTVSGGFASNVSHVLLAPLQQIFSSFMRPEPSAAEPLKTGDGKIRLDDALVEELVRRFDPVMTSKFRDFGETINRKFEDFEKQHKRAHDELIRDRTVLRERLESLETLIVQSKNDEPMKELREEVAKLREEIRSKETKIQNDFYTLLSLTLRMEPGKEMNFDDLKTKFVSIFRSIEEAHFKVDKLNQEFFNYVNNASERIEVVMERSKERVKFDLRTFIEKLIANKVAEWKMTTSSGTTGLYGDIDVLEKYVKRIVDRALEVYDADKTGMADYALESAGGSVLSTRCTETHKSYSEVSVLGIPLWRTNSNARTVIQPGAHPGECWAFHGSVGYLVIQLSHSIFITSVSLEHIPKAIASNGTIDSAPKDFSVWAARSELDPEAKFLGKFRYDDDGPGVQTFEVIPLGQPYQIVELKILSNYGNIDYTCLYRFRVHGIPV